MTDGGSRTAGSLDGGPDDRHAHHAHRIPYEEAVRLLRDDKDAWLRLSPDSPIPSDQRAAFAGLAYYAVDAAYAFDGLELEPLDGHAARFEMATTDGRRRPAQRAGMLRFRLRGGEHALTAYRLDGGGDVSLFVPFLYATSGVQTYGAGRYLDLEPDDDGTWTLDFNLAYHPSCAFDTRFSCPLPPAENRLSIPIEAGERLAPGEAAPR